MQSTAKHWPVPTVISLGTVLVQYLSLVGLVILAGVVPRLGFYGRDMFLSAAAALIVACPVLGIWSGSLAVYRYRHASWTLWGKRLSILGLVLNILNGLLLCSLSKL
jgi:hypothetical protein